MEKLLKECDKWEEEANEESRGKDKCQSQEELMVKELKDNLQDEYIEGDDELTRRLREFWFGSSPFVVVGMGGRDFLLALRDFIKDFIENETTKEWEKEANRQVLANDKK